MLWFDVEEGYNTTKYLIDLLLSMLWFDVEDQYTREEALEE